MILNHAEDDKDVALFERALAKLRERFGAEERTGRLFKKQEARLEKLKKMLAADAGDEPDSDDGI